MSKVSYVVTVYNKAPYLPYVTAGLAAQWGDFEREYIFVNDGSTDGSRECLLGLIADWQHATLIDQDNAGPALALNRGLAAATGDLIKPMDGDDLLLPDATRSLLDALEQTGLNLAFGEQGDYDPARGLEAGLAAAVDQSAHGPVTALADSLERTLRRAQTTPSAWLACTATVRAAGGCDPRVFIQDYSIELRLARQTGFAHLAAPVFLAPSAAPGRMSEQDAQTLHDINLAVCNFLADHPDLPPQLRRYATQRVLGLAWTWRRRRGDGRSLGSAEFRRHIIGRLGWLPEGERLTEAACGPFRATHPIRRTVP
jgi:glycosyltransferase involved in cell wall biosynthesis